MRERERIRNEININRVINGVKITEARHEKLKRVLSKEFGVTWGEMISRSRAGRVVQARRYYFNIMRYMFLYTLGDIGALTQKHHATVIHNIKVLGVYMELYEDEKKRYNRIKNIMLEEVSAKEIRERVEFLEEQKEIIQHKIDDLLINKKRINEILTNK